MNKLRFTLNILGTLVFILALTTLTQAQATRTWVSGVGDDANPCSRTAPCKTFAGAISKTAAGGVIVAIDPGGYGQVTITKSITPEGSGTLTSMLATGNGIIINITNASDSGVVVIRGIDLNGISKSPGAAGITVAAAKDVKIQDVVVDGFGLGVRVG